MKQLMDLNKMGLTEMSTFELLDIEGSKMPSWAKKIGIAGVLTWIADNWTDIKSGAASGWEDYEKQHR